MRNGWNEYHRHKPKRNGWYSCTIYFEEDCTMHKGKYIASYVMDLYYDVKTNRWIDNRRQSVFDAYEVYGHTAGPDGTVCLERKYADNHCVRTDVIAFKKLPPVYRKEG